MYEGTAGDLINRVRKACRTIQTSPVLNDELEKVAAESGICVSLVLDVQTRWNSIPRMLRNFLRLEESLRDFNKDDRDATFDFSSGELATLKQILKALTIVEICSKRISSADATLRSADIAMQVSSSFIAPLAS